MGREEFVEALLALMKKSEPLRDRFRGKLGAPDAATVEVAGRANHVWFREDGNPSKLRQIFNNRTPNIPDLPVIVGYDIYNPQVEQVLDIDINMLPDWYGRTHVPQHHKTHELGATDGLGTRVDSDVVYLQKGQYLPLKLRPASSNSMLLFVEPDWYAFGDQQNYWPGGLTKVFSAPVTDGQAAMELVCIDGATNTLLYVRSADFESGSPLNQNTIPTPPTGSVPLGAVYLPHGVTALTAANISDSRIFNRTFGGIVSGYSHSHSSLVDGGLLFRGLTVTGDQHWVRASDQKEFLSYFSELEELHMYGDVSVTGNVIVTGGALRMLDSRIEVKDNLTNALSLIDDGGTDPYFTVVSTNAQRKFVFNQDEADIDYQFKSVGEANALLVQGSDGYVSIGKSAPDNRLDVYDNISNVYVAHFFNDAASAGHVVHIQTDGTAGGTSALWVETATEVNSFIVRGDGTVGIGAASPSRKLEVRDSEDPSVDYIGIIINNAFAASWQQGEKAAAIEFAKDGDVNAYIASMHTRAGGDHTNPDSGLVFATSTGATPDLAEHVVITHDGNVGIGILAALPAKLSVNGTTRLGDPGGANYSAFAADGYVTLEGTARASEDIQFNIVVLKPGAAAPTAAIIGITPVLLFDTTTDDEAHLILEVPHNYDAGTDFRAHFHWAPTDGNAGDVTWGIEYHITRDENNEVLTAATTTAIIVDATQSLQDEVLESGNITIDGTGVQSEDHIHIRIFRDADASEGGASDTYANDAALISFDIEYMINSFGADTQF